MYYQIQELYRQMCNIHRIYYFDGSCGIGASRIIATGTKYTSDNIHQTQLGGYILAQSLYNFIKNVPLFYDSVPS